LIDLEKVPIYQFFLRYPVLWLSFALLIFVLPIRPEILSWTNLETLALAIALLSVLAIGESFVLITAGIDLSLPAVMSLASVLGASVLVHQAFAVSSFGALVGAVGLMLATGVLLGLLHGISVAYFKMPAFLVSLASLMLVGGVAVWYTESSRVNVTADFIDIWYGRLLGIPYPILLSAFVAFLANGILKHTVNGRRLYAVGHSLKTARLSGVPVERTLIFAYVASGLCAAIASVLYTARLHTGSPELVENEVLLDCIGAAVIGGTSLFGGKGKIAGIVMGAAFIALVSNSLNMLGLRYWHVIMIKGGVILLAATLDAVQRRLIVNGQNQ
jgi:ribose/xylose/arabinose/galactoside ABC-type transport system permease subunit